VLKYPLERAAKINDMSISLEALDILDAGLTRLRQYNGHFHLPKSKKSGPDEAALPFWFSEPKYVPLYVFSCNAHYTDNDNSDYDTNGAIISVDEAVMQYQTTVRRYKIAIEGLSNLSRSLEIQMRKMDVIMRPVVVANGIGKIPDDVLARIFECVNEPWPADFYRRLTPGKLRTVCKRFQEVVDSLPSLRREFSSKMPIGGIEGHLNEQAQVGLRVEISGRSCYSDKRADAVAAFTMTLAPHAHRWEELRLFHAGSTNRMKQAYENLKSLVLPRLERLTLWSENWTAADKIYSTWTAPKLRRIVLNDGVPMKLPGESNILECDLVVEGYELENYIPSSCELLESLTSLTTLRLRFRAASLVDTYDLEIGRIHLPNLQSFEADLFFTPFSDADKDDYEPSTVSDTGEAIYCFIYKLDTPRIEELRVIVSHDTCWNYYTTGCLCFLFRTHGKSRTLRTLEFTQEGHRLDTSDSFRSIFHRPCNSNVVLSGLIFDSSRHDRFELEDPKCNGDVLGLRTLTFKDCRLSIDAIMALLKLYTASGLYPYFEGITLTQCAGISRESLRGVVGSEYVVFSDE
jgi:hypothetical protein